MEAYLTWSIAQKSTRARDLRGRLHALRADMFSDLLLDADVVSLSSYKLQRSGLVLT